MAELLGVRPRFYARWKTGNATPLLRAVVRIVDILDGSLDELAGRKETNGNAHIYNPQLRRMHKNIDERSDEA